MFTIKRSIVINKFGKKNEILYIRSTIKEERNYMLTFKTPILTAPFKEHPVADITREEPQEFDIKPEDKFTLEHYCKALLLKIITLNKSKIKPFIRYQVEILSDPFVWLNKLEKLIDLNREQFITKDENCKLDKALMVIEVFRQEIETGKFSNSKYNFKKVKQKIQCYKSPEEKLSYLLEVKTEYLQYKPPLIDPTEVAFDIQCDLEMTLLKTQVKLKKRSLSTTEDEKSKRSLSEVEGLPKLQINSKLNCFVDVFYQMMYEKQINGKPYLSATPSEVAEVISKIFIDKEGNEISQDSVKTILRPSRFEKRPKGNARLNID